MKKYDVITEHSGIVYSGSNEVAAKAIYDEYVDKSKTDPASVGTVKFITDDNEEEAIMYTPADGANGGGEIVNNPKAPEKTGENAATETAADGANGGGEIINNAAAPAKTGKEGEETAADGTNGGGEIISEKLSRRLPLLENMNKFYKGGKLINEGEENISTETEEIVETKEVPEDELVDIDEAVDVSKLKSGDEVRIQHKSDGPMNVTVKTVKDGKIFWANDKGQMGSISAENAGKRIGAPKK